MFCFGEINGTYGVTCCGIHGPMHGVARQELHFWIIFRPVEARSLCGLQEPTSKMPRFLQSGYKQCIELDLHILACLQRSERLKTTESTCKYI